MDLMHLLRAREGRGPHGLDAQGRHHFQRDVAALPCWVPRLQRVRRLKGHRGCVNTIQWSPNGNFLISGSDDTKLKIWDMTRMKKHMTLSPGHSANVFCARFLPHTNEEQVVSCAAEGNIIVTHVPRVGRDSRAQVRHLFTCHNNIVNRIVIDPNGSNVFFSCGDDGTIRRFDRRAHHECRGAGEPCEDNVFVDLTSGDKFTNRNVGLNALTINPSTGLHIATAGSDPFVRLYDVRNPSEPFRVFRPSWHSEVQRRTQSLYMPYPHLTSLAFDRTGTELLASYGGDYIYLLSTVGGADGATVADRMEVEDGMEERPRASPASPTGQRTVSGDDGGDEERSQPATAQWGRKRGRSESDNSTVSGEEEEDENEDSSEEEKNALSESEEENEDNESEDEDEDDDDDDDDDEIGDDDDNPWDLDGAAEAELDEDPRIRNPEVSVNYKRQWKGHLNVRTIKEVNFFGPDDQYILSGSDDGNIFVWEKRTGKLVQLLKGDATIVNCVQGTPPSPVPVGHPLDYPTLAASGLDHDVKVFMPTAKSACRLDHAQQAMDKNTHTLEHGRSLAGEMAQQLAIFMNEDDPEGDLDQNCALS